MRNLTLKVAAFLVLFIGCSKNQKGSENLQESSDIEKNKEISAKYHELNANYIDSILTDNFMGRNAKDLHTWTKENHREYLSNKTYKKDSVLQQIAEGELVATRFIRNMNYEGDTVSVYGMQFKRFENGKIAEIDEYWDYPQLKEIMDKSEARKKK